MRFRTTIELGGKTATGMAVPAEIVAGLGTSRRPAVRVTVNGYTYRSTIAPMGGRFLIPVSAEVRAGSGLAAGDEVDVDVELDTAPREVEVPPDFAAIRGLRNSWPVIGGQNFRNAMGTAGGRRCGGAGVS